MIRKWNPAVLWGFIGCCLLSACGDDTPSAEKVMAAINRDSIRTQNGIALSPDYRELYISLPIEEIDKKGRTRVRIFRRAWTGSAYGPPEPVSFNSNFTDYHPVISPDGKRLFFNSTRPKPGTQEEQETVDIWYIENWNMQGATAKYLPIINTEGEESYPSVDGSGNLYFNSDRLRGGGVMDIWVAESRDYTFQAPHALNAISSVDSENDLTISPDGQTLIFNRFHFNGRTIDLYRSRRENRRWSEPELLGEVNEADIWELTPTIGPNGQLFLYERNGIIRAMDFQAIN